MENVFLALIAMMSPVIMAWLVNRNSRKMKELDWTRQDAVAAQATEAAKLLKENNEVVAVSTAETQKQLHVIHTLVNSTLTAALQGRLDAHKKSIILMHRIIELNSAQNVDPSASAIAEIKAAEKEISDLEMEISDRLGQAKIATSL